MEKTPTTTKGLELRAETHTHLQACHSERHVNSERRGLAISVSGSPRERGYFLDVEVADYLRSLRVSAGLQQAELAELLGLARSTISQIETGKRGTSMQVMEAWARICGGKIEFLLPDEKKVSTNLGGLDDQRRKLVKELSDVVGQVPDPLVEDLLDRVEAWKRRYSDTE